MVLRRFLVVLVIGGLGSLGMAPAASSLGFAHPRVVSQNPVDYTPHVQDGSVRAVAVVGARVYVGGTFSTVVDAGRSAELTRRFVLAFDRTTGKVLPFAPSLDGAVETIAPAPDGSSIIVGGRFKTVNGSSQRSLAMIAADGSRVSSFTARTNGYVTKALVRGNRLLAGGRFSKASGVTRSNLAAFDLSSTGAATLESTFDIAVTEGRTKSNGTVTRPVVYEMDANAAGSRLVIIGNFRKVGGQARQQIAMIDLVSETVTSWYTNRYPNDAAGTHAFQCYQVFDTQMRDVEFSADGSYFVVVTTGGAPDRNVRSLCDTAARWETATKSLIGGEVETWRNCTGGDTLYSVAITAGADGGGGAVYVGGHQRWLDNCGGRDSAVAGSFAANGIGAIDARTGRAIRTWNPGRTRGVGAEELVADSEGLYIGSDTQRLGGEYHARIGLFPL